MFRKLFYFASLFFIAVTPAFFATADEPIIVTKSVRDNPTLFFKGVTGDEGLSRELRSFLTACGWFDVVNNPDANYTLSGRVNSGTLRLEMEDGGAPGGAWQVSCSGGDRKTAQRAVDDIIEQIFKELKVRGFCSTRIAFCAETRRGVRNIYACDIDGGNVEQITNYTTLCVEPCWFPGGKSIGYSRYKRSGIDVVETQLNPKRSRVLTNFNGINTGVAISPDGRNLALILSPDHVVDLYVMPIGGRPRRLTRSKSVEASPCWSPDGREIAYVSDETGRPRIYTIAVNGSSRKRLPSIGIEAVTPDWSSDGKIVYATRVGGQYTLAVYDTKTGKNERVTEAPGSWESPAWAADNRQVVCKRTDGPKSALYVVDTWTGRTRLLTSTPYNLSMPVWSKARAVRP